MGASERVTVTLPAELVERIDRVERSRTRFITEAVEQELARRSREALLRSLDNPHLETASVAEAGFGQWAHGLRAGDEGLIEARGGRAVRWVEGRGWSEDPGED
ncbi:hypothetical protein [Vulgatibacter sp.]|uniref:hypothetical protein n=1 Tax=Vulgatibacter sp. TaxID=1971226 RepID=UPI00356401F4